MSSKPLRVYTVTHLGLDGEAHDFTTSARSRAAARYELFTDIAEPYPDLSFRKFLGFVLTFAEIVERLA